MGCAEANHVTRLRVWGRLTPVAPRTLKAETILGPALLVRFARGGNLFLGRVAAIGVAGFDQLLGIRGVDVETLALHVRAMVASQFGALVPVEAQPAHRFQHDLDALVGAALAIGILDPQNERALVSARPEPAVECGSHAADVQVARRRRGKANANCGHGGRATCRP